MAIAEHRRLLPGALLEHLRCAKIGNPRIEPALIALVEPTPEPGAGAADAVPAAR
jgi:hypothetical protein